MDQPKENQPVDRKCPLNGFGDCLLRGCAWYYANECAVASMGYIDHTLHVIAGALMGGEDGARYAAQTIKEGNDHGNADAVPGAGE